MESRLTLPVYAEIEITERPVTPECLRLLSDEQLTRAARFTKPLRRNQHIWARVLIRLLAEKLYPDIPRHSIQIVEDPPRAPRIVLPDGVLRTSITHSGNRVACLVDSEICAADLEKIDLSRPLLRYADVAFNHETAARVKAEPDIGTAFFRAWGAYECAVKADCPREFYWEDHEPRIRGMVVSTDLTDGWMRVTALSRKAPVALWRPEPEMLETLAASGRQS